MGHDMTGALAGRWLSKNEIDEEGQLGKIKRVTLETVGDENEEKYALHFSNLDKPLLLNKTNIRVLVEAFGGDSDAWLGKSVQVYFDDTVSFGGKRIGGIRLKVPKAKPAPGKAIADMEDDIPF